MKKTVRSIIKKFLAFFAAIIMLSAESNFMLLNASESPNTTLRVAFPITKSISEIDEYGRYTGLLVDYLNEISKYTGWKYEYILTDSEYLTDDFKAGKFDLMGGVFYSEEFEEYFEYPKFSMGNSYGILACSNENNDIKSYDLTTLNGKKIGVFDQSKEKIQKLHTFLAVNSLDCKVIEYTSDEMTNGNLYDHLKNGDVDLILGNDSEPYSENDLRVVASYIAQPYYIVTQNGNDKILEQLNSSLKYILESNPDFGRTNYIITLSEISDTNLRLSQAEIDYVKSKQSVSVAVIKDWHPFFKFDSEENSASGIIPDLLKLISDYSGFQFTYIFADTYAEMVEMVQNGEADIVGCFLDNEESSAEKGLALSKDFVSVNNIVVKNKSVPFPDDNLTGGILNGRVMPPNVLTDNIIYFSTPKEALEAVNRGKISFFYGLSAHIDREMQSHLYPNISPVTRVNNSTEVSLAIPRPVDPILLSILNKSIESISDSEKNALLDKNLISLGHTSMTFIELIYANPIAFVLILSVFLVMIFLSILFWTHIRLKNSIMQNDLEKAEAKSKSKSEFLSQMSHEIRTPMNAIMGLTDLISMGNNIPEDAKEKLEKIRSSSQYMMSLINDILDMSRIENGKLQIETEIFSLTSVLNETKEMMSSQAEHKLLTFKVTRNITHDFLAGDPIRLRQVLTNLLSNAIKFTPSYGNVELTATEISSEEGKALYYFSVQDTGIGISAEEQEKIFHPFEQLGPNTSKSMGTGLGLPISCSIVSAMGGTLSVDSHPNKGSNFFFTIDFPIKSAPKEDTKKDICDTDNLNGIHILLAEDNDINAEIVKELLEMKGAIVTLAVNGQEAVDIFKESSSGWFSLILMDIRMPVKNGLEATKEIRCCSKPDAETIPIVAMTANSFKDDEEDAISSGMNGFIPKPVDLVKLVCILNSIITK